MAAVWSVHLLTRLRVGPSLLTATSCRSPKDIYCFLICHKGDTVVCGVAPWGLRVFPASAWAVSQDSSFLPQAKKRARDANWQLQTVSRSECECEWSFVFLWPAINWQLVHGVALPSHPRTAGIGCTQPPCDPECRRSRLLIFNQCIFFYLFILCCLH